MQRVLQDLRYAVRGALREPAFAAAVIGTLGVGIGASAAMFSVVRGVLLTPLDFDQPQELVSLWLRAGEHPKSPLPPADFVDVRRNTASLSAVAGRWAGATSLTGDGEAEQVDVAWVSQNYLPTLGIVPALGRGFDGEELDAVILSDRLWRGRYGGDSALVGRTIQLGGESVAVVGVLPQGTNPNVGTMDGVREENDVFRVLPDQWIGDDRVTGWIRVVGRMKPGLTAAAVEADLANLSRQLRAAVPDRAETDLELYSHGVLDELVRSARPYLLTFSGGVLFVFLIACVNVTNLLLVRAQRRRVELAVRTAIGAGRGALVREAVAESLVLATAGGALGVLFANTVVGVLVRLNPANLPRLEEVTVDGSVVAFGIIASVVAAVGVAIVPAFRAARTNPASMVQARATTPGPRHRRFASVLIALEVALSLVLLTGSGLFIRTFVALRGVDPGFEPRNVITYRLSAPSLNGQESAGPYLQQVIERTEALPGVEVVSFTNRFPLGGGIFGGNYATEALYASGADRPESSFRWVTAGFFDGIGAHLLQGRVLTPADSADAVVVDDLLAGRAWPGENPIGKRVWTGTLGREDWSTVVGVVRHIRHESLIENGRPTVYFLERLGAHRLLAVIRTAGRPEPLIPAVRNVVRSLDADARADLRRSRGASAGWRAGLVACRPAAMRSRSPRPARETRFRCGGRSPGLH